MTTTSQDKAHRVQRMAVRLASYMGEGWRLDPTGGFGSRIVGPNGHGLNLADNRQGRVTIKGVYPEDGYRTWPSITVAMDRPDRAVYGDVRRRLWPAYLNAFEQVSAEQKRRAAQAAEDERARAALRAAMPALRDAQRGRRQFDLVSYMPAGPTVKVSCDAGHVRIEATSLPVDLTVRVLEVLARYAPAG